MLERVGVFLFSLLMVVGSLGVAVWLIATGQAVGVDGLFLILVCLVFALIFAICVFLLIKSGMEPAKAPTAAKPAPTAQSKAKESTQSAAETKA